MPRCCHHRTRARPGGEPPHRVFHRYRIRAGPRDRSCHANRARNDGAVGHGVGHGVIGVRHHRDCHRHRFGSGPRWRQPAVLLLSRRPHRHGHARHHWCDRLGGHIRSGGRQRRRHCRDVRRVLGRGREDHGQPRRRRQHDQGRHQGLRHRVSGHRCSGHLRQLHRDRRQRDTGARRGQGVEQDSPRRLRRDPDQCCGPEGVHRPAHRWIGELLVLGPCHPCGLSHGRCGRAGGPQPVRRRQDHVRRASPRLWPGHRHLHEGIVA